MPLSRGTYYSIFIFIESIQSFFVFICEHIWCVCKDNNATRAHISGIAVQCIYTRGIMMAEWASVVVLRGETEGGLAKAERDGLSRSLISLSLLRARDSAKVGNRVAERDEDARAAAKGKIYNGGPGRQDRWISSRRVREIIRRARASRRQCAPRGAAMVNRTQHYSNWIH